MSNEALGLPPDDKDAAAYDAVVEEFKALSDAEAIARVVAMDDMAYDRVRERAAKGLRVLVSTLDKKRKAAQPRGAKQGRALELLEAEPWDEPVDGDALLDDICRAMRRYLVIDESSLHVLALWAFHTYCYELWPHTPRLHISAPKRRSGKSRVLDVLEQLVARPLRTDGLTAAVVFRLTEDRHPTILADEIDQWLDPRGELIGILNSGHCQGTKAYRCVGDEHEVKAFDVFSPLALAGIGKIRSDTLADRSIKVTIRRRLKCEQIERFRRDRTAIEFEPLRRQIARWLADAAGLEAHEPQVPEIIDNDRQVDNWWPLLCIADLVGGDWADRARQAMTAQAFAEADDTGWDILVLRDIRDLFDETGKERLFTKEILDRLHQWDERPWGEYPSKRGPAKPITDRQLSALLKPHEIESKVYKRPPDKPARGYDRVSFEETWRRYVPTPDSDALNVTALHPAENLTESGNGCDAPSVTTRYPLPEGNGYDGGNGYPISSVTGKPAESLAGNRVTDKAAPTASLRAEIDNDGAVDADDEPDPFEIPPWLDRRRSARWNDGTE